MKKDYILYDYYPVRRPLPVRRSKRPSWPIMFNYGPYWVEFTEQGCRYSLRRGTRAYRRMLERQQQEQQASKDMGVFVLFFFLFWLIIGLAAVVQSRF